MEVSELTLKLIIILIPGAIASIIYEKLTIHRKWTAFQFIANSILFGGISYLLAQLIFNYYGNDQSLSNFWLNLSSKEIPFSAVTKATIISIFIGFICAGLDRYKIINNIAKFLRLTTKYGDENLYSYFLNAKNVSEVYIRDVANNITYHGIIDSFSETTEFKEIVLRDVKIYEYETSKFMYDVDKVYLCKPKDDLIIEVPFINQKSEQNVAETQVQAPK